MSFRYPHPGNERDFELFSLKLLIRHWNNPSLELYGKRGERQLGVDIIDLGSSRPFKGAQCKHHEPDKTLPPAEIRAEVEKAKGFDPPLDHFAILTTGRVTTQAHNEVIEINREHTASGRFQVELFSWERIERLLEEYPEIKDELLTASNSQLDAIGQRLTAIQAQATAGADATTTVLDMEIDEAQGHLDRNEHQMAGLHLRMIKRRKWDLLSPRQKYRVEAAFANVLLAEGKQAEAARLLLSAKLLQPESERALVNEALAHEFLGDKSKAYSLAAVLLVSYPASAKLTATLIRNAPPSDTLEGLEGRVSLTASEDPEVAVALALKAMEQKQFARAEEFARRGVSAKPDWLGPHVLLGQACLAGEIARSELGYWADRPEVDRAKIEHAIAAFDRAIQLAHGQKVADATIDPLLGRAMSRALLGDEDGADRDFNEAARLAPDHPGVLFRFATHLHDRRDLGGAIKALTRSTALKPSLEADYYLASVLRERDEAGDRRRATGLLIRWALVETLTPDLSLYNHAPERLGRLRAEAFHGAVDGLIEGSRLEELGDFLGGLPDGRFSSVAMATARSRLALAEGDRSVAVEAANEAFAGVAEDTSRDDLRALAIQLMRLERHKDALPLWERLNVPGQYAGDVRHLIKCAERVNRHDIILEVCKALRESGVDDPWLLHRESDVLEAYDIEGAVTVLRDYLSRHPTDLVGRARLSRLGLILGRDEIVDSRPEALPDVETATPTVGVLVVEILRRCGKPTEAVEYAYELLRRNFDEPLVNQAFVMAVLAPKSLKSSIEHPEAVRSGTAACYVEGSGPDRWVIVEDSPDPQLARDEYPPDHPLSRELDGKRPGDTVVVGKSSARDRTAVIKEIVSKYIYRMRDVAESWQIRFRDTPWIEVYRTARRDPTTGLEAFDMTDLKLIADGRFERRVDAEGQYEAQVLPIHVFAKLLGCGDFEAARYAALRIGLVVHCSQGTSEERARSIDALESGDVAVLELSAIATLGLFGEEGLLERWKGKLVISQETAAELRALLQREGDGGTEGPRGRFGRSERGYHFVREDEETRRQADRREKEYIELVLASCEVRGCRELAWIDPEKREELLDAFGQHGVESMMLGSQPNHLLWTDDLYLASVASSEFGTRHAWTQIAVEHGVRRGYFDEGTYRTVSAKLLGLDYRSTTFNPAVIHRAASLAEWNPDRWPFDRVLEQFANPAIDLMDVVGLTAATISALYRDASLIGSRQAALIRIAEKLSGREEGRETVRAMISVLPRLFGLNVIALAEATGTLRAWLAEAARRPEFR